MNLEVKKWREEAEAEQDERRKKVLDSLWHEAAYRLELCAARALRDRGNLEEALEHFKEMSRLREKLLDVKDEQIVDLLDLIWGNPTPEQERVWALIEAREEQSALFKLCLQHAFQDTPSPQKVLDGLKELAEALRINPDILTKNYRLLEMDRDYGLMALAAARRVDPGNPILAGAYHLLEVVLEVDRDYERVRGNLLLEAFHWRRLLEAWEKLIERAKEVPDDGKLARLRQVWIETRPELEKRLEERGRQISSHWEECRQKVQDALFDPLQSPEAYEHQMPEIVQEAHRGQAAAAMLGETWPEGLKPENVEKKMNKKLEILRLKERCEKIQKALNASVQSPEEYRRQMSEAVEEARQGQEAAKSLGERWLEALKPERVEENMKERLATFHKERLRIDNAIHDYLLG